MSKGRRPLTDADRERIATDAARLLDWLDANARDGSSGRTVVQPRRRVAEALGLTVVQLGRAEALLLHDRRIRSQRLVPRNPAEATRDMFRWTLPYPDRPPERIDR